MGTQTTTSALATIKTVYLEAFRNLSKTKISPFYNEIVKKTTGSANFEVAASVGQVGGYGAMSENGTLPTAGELKYIKFTGSVKNIALPIRITDKAIQASKNIAGSSVGNLLKNEIMAGFETAKINFSRQVVAGNGTGILATTNANGGSTSIVVSQHRFLDIGMTIDIHPATGDKIGTRRIASITRNADGTGTIVVDSTINTAAADSYITIQNSLGAEISGIDSIFNSAVTSYMGLVKANNSTIVPVTVDAAHDISNGLIRDMIANSDDYRNGNTNMILCGAAAYRAYSDYLDSMTIPMQTLDLVGGFKACRFIFEDREIRMVREKFIATGDMIGVNTKDFEEHSLCDWSYMDEDDSPELLRVAGTDYYETVIRKYPELVCKNPGALWKLTDCGASA